MVKSFFNDLRKFINDLRNVARVFTQPGEEADGKLGFVAGPPPHVGGYISTATREQVE